MTTYQELVEAALNHLDTEREFREALLFKLASDLAYSVTPNKHSSSKALEQERDEHVLWTKQHYGNKSADKIKAIYDEGIAIQSSQNPLNINETQKMTTVYDSVTTNRLGPTKEPGAEIIEHPLKPII